MDLRKIALFIGVVAVAAVAGLFLLRGVVSLISKRPSNLGVIGGRLAPCPSYPNCVSSQSQDDTHRVEPIPFTTSSEAASAKMLEIIGAMPHSSVVEETTDYLYAEFTTPGLHYVDDVEFYFDEANRLIHVRSAARLPYYDFNVNRNRVELIHSLFLGQ